jgi:TetR/AcrR family transcriptional regulator, regulator of autoinduction and epiphytic fitness
MTETPKPKRTYTSTRRQLQARQTRRLILEEARKLFDERGYEGTTIEAIAQQAGVAPETIYAVFGSKLAILKKLVEVTLVGDDQPTPLLERPFIRENFEETDPRQFIRRFAETIYPIMLRMAPVFALLKSTAKSDPEIASLRERLLKERLSGMSMFVHQLQRLVALREGLLPTEASAAAWTLSSAEVFDLLTRDLGWGEEQYTGWLSDALERLLLE